MQWERIPSLMTGRATHNGGILRVNESDAKFVKIHDIGVIHEGQVGKAFSMNGE